MPINVRQFVFVREIVTRFTFEGLLQRVSKPLRQMFGRRRECGPSLLIRFPSHDLCQRVVFDRPFCLLLQKMPDLFAVLIRVVVPLNSTDQAEIPEPGADF
jgi:hypothetical protein